MTFLFPSNLILNFKIVLAIKFHMNMNIDYRDIITSIFYKLMFFFHVIMYNILLALLKKYTYTGCNKLDTEKWNHRILI